MVYINTQICDGRSFFCHNNDSALSKDKCGTVHYPTGGRGMIMSHMNKHGI